MLHLRNPTPAIQKYRSQFEQINKKHYGIFTQNQDVIATTHNLSRSCCQHPCQPYGGLESWRAGGSREMPWGRGGRHAPRGLCGHPELTVLQKRKQAPTTLYKLPSCCKRSNSNARCSRSSRYIARARVTLKKIRCHCRSSEEL